MSLLKTFQLIAITVLTEGGIVSVSGEWNVRPRIIFISDGYPTESSEDKGQDVAKNINHVSRCLK